MKKYFPTAQVHETHQHLFEFIMPFSTTRLSRVFQRIEKNRDLLDIKDYSITQTTLDQVFINFAKQQKEDLFEDQPKTQNQNDLEAGKDNFYNSELSLNKFVDNEDDDDRDDADVVTSRRKLKSNKSFASTKTGQESDKNVINNYKQYYLDKNNSNLGSANESRKASVDTGSALPQNIFVSPLTEEYPTYVDDVSGKINTEEHPFEI
jgi:hypothetical protein